MNRMSNITGFLCLSLTVVIMAACIKDGSYDVAPVDPDSQVVRMHIRVPGNPSVSTRGFADTFIQTIDVLSFSADAGTFQYRSSASVIDSSNEWFDITLSKSGSQEQVLVVLANLKDELDATILTSGSTTVAQLRDLLTIEFVHRTSYDPTHNPSNEVSGQYGADRPLPMWGEYGPVAIVEEVTDLGTIYMLRSLAAVTVLINLDRSDPDQKDFELVDVAIYNTVDSGYAIPDPDNIETSSAGSVKATSPTVPTGVVYDNAYYASSDGVTITDGIYIGERSNTASGIDEEDRTWLLIAGIYDNSGEVTWYRLPFIDRDGKQWDILRNHNFIFNIYKVSGPGTGEEEATDADIYADVIPWNEGADEVFDIDGQYWIWVDPTSASYDILGGTGTVTVDTNFPGGCTATVSGSETELDVPCTWLTADGSPTGTALNYSVAVTDQWIHRVGYIHIRAGSFAVAVRIDQAQLYLESISVTPTGNISGDGEDRVIRATGLFDDIPVQVWDLTNDTEITQAAANSFIPANYTTGNPSSVTVTIPGWSQDIPRVIEFRYYDKTSGSWVAIMQATQEGFDFDVASTLTDNSTIAARDQTYNINVTGTGWPELYVRGVIRGTGTVVAGPITIPAGAGSVQQSITIGTFEQWKDQAARVVELQWSRSGTDWTSATVLNYGNQWGDYEITGSSSSDPAIENGENLTIRAFLPYGGDLTVTVTGSYSAGWVQVRAVTSDGATVVSSTSPDITDISAMAVNLTILSNYNYSGTYGSDAGHRDIKCQYRRYIDGVAESTWTDVNMATIKQLGYVTLSTGRVVAIEDAGPNGRVGDDGVEIMLWATAMGIDSKYNTETYQQAGASADGYTYSTSHGPYPLQAKRSPTLYYTETYSAANGGCAAYTEDGTTKNFYIPTVEETYEMGQRFIELGKIAYAYPWDYWSNSEVFSSNSYRSWVLDLEYKGWNDNVRSTNSKRARCVREK